MAIRISSMIVWVVFDMELEAKGVSKTVNPLYIPLTKPCTPAQSCVLPKERITFLIFTNLLY